MKFAIETRAADAGADERGHAPPGAEIGVGVGKNHPLRLGAVIGIGAEPTDIRDRVFAEELRIAAPFTGDVGAEPVVELVTGAEAEDAGGIEGEVLR